MAGDARDSREAQPVLTLELLDRVAALLGIDELPHRQHLDYRAQRYARWYLNALNRDVYSHRRYVFARRRPAYAGPNRASANQCPQRPRTKLPSAMHFLRGFPLKRVYKVHWPGGVQRSLP